MRFHQLVPVLVFLAAWGEAAPVEACGVKLLMRTGAIKPREGVKRSSNPSRVLLLGDTPRSVVRDLKTAGHQVDVAQTASAAKPKDYRVILTSAADADEARRTFPNAKIVTRSSFASTDVANVEAGVARERMATASARSPVSRRQRAEPVAAGPTQNPDYRRLVATKPVEETPATPLPVAAKETKAEKPVEKPPAEQPAPPVRPPEPPPAPVKAAAKPTPVEEEEPRAVQGALVREIGFAFGGSRLSPGASAKVARLAAWMSKNATVSIVIEGHADSVGSEEYNLWLSEKRAKAVKAQLEEAGVDASRMEIAAHGESRPLYGDGTDKRNRRVAIVKK